MQGDSGNVLDSALEATVDTHEWRLEVERVLPSLKIHFRQDNRVRGCHTCMFQMYLILLTCL